MEKFAREYTDAGDPADLSGYCAIASYFLVMLGRKFGYYLTLVEGLAFDCDVDALQSGDYDGGKPFANHFWVEYSGTIIDLTATQFNNVRKVHIVDDDDENYWLLTQNNAARKNLRLKWPEEQTPYAYIKELKQRVNTLSLALNR